MSVIGIFRQQLLEIIANSSAFIDLGMLPP
jgi:hypothetical protein